MNQVMTAQTTAQKLAVAIATASATASVTSWILLVLLSGSLVPRAVVIGAVLAAALAVCAHRAVRSGETWVLLMAATFGAVPPFEIGSAPAPFRYIGFFALGYALAAMFLAAPS